MFLYEIKCEDNSNICTYSVKDDDSIELPQERKVIGSNKPQIGITESEVEESTWGRPRKRNKSTYSWGTTEQWVYSNNRYIYFKNGKVSSISE